jgi:hypothetical protein
VSTGIHTAACVTVDGDCRIACDVFPDQIEFKFGDNESGLHLFFTPSGFGKFLSVALQMAERLQIERGKEWYWFAVGDEEREAEK